MRLPRAVFDDLWKTWSNLNKFPMTRSSPEARIFTAGSEKYPVLNQGRGSNKTNYFLYADIGGVVRPLERGIETTLIKAQPVVTESPYALECGAPIRAEAPSEKVLRAMRKGDRLANAIATYEVSGLAFYFDKPLELMAYLDVPNGSFERWNFLLLRDSSEGDFGHLNDCFYFPGTERFIALRNLELTDPKRHAEILKKVQKITAESPKNDLAKMICDAIEALNKVL